jgi:hypothetical protein
MEWVMLKLPSLMAGLSIAFLPFPSNILPAAAIDRSPSPGLSGSAIADDNLVCYMHTIDGRTVNLNRICGNNTTGNNVTNSNSPNSSNSSNSPTAVNAPPSNNLGGLGVNQAPGTPACYGFDAQGLPCPPPQ